MEEEDRAHEIPLALHRLRAIDDGELRTIIIAAIENFSSERSGDTCEGLNSCCCATRVNMGDLCAVMYEGLSFFGRRRHARAYQERPAWLTMR